MTFHHDRSLTHSGKTSFLWALVLLAVVVGCGDDDSAEPRPATGGSGGSGGIGGDASMDAGGGRGGADGSSNEGGRGPSPVPACMPDLHEGDACLECLTTSCCDELLNCGALFGSESGNTLIVETYVCYDDFLSCVRECASDSDEDGGTSADRIERLASCGMSCDPNYDLVRSEILACIAGTDYLPLLQLDAGVEDSDLGDGHCQAECLPGW